MMDIFCEYLVARKSAQDKLIKALAVLGCILVCIFSFYFLFFIKIQWMWLTPIIWGAAIYGTRILCQQFSVEFEYSFTNGVLDIDKICGRARRKNIVSVACKNIERMAPARANFTTERTIINANYDEKLGRKYYVNFSKSGVAYTLLFQPPEKILDNMKKYNPRNIEL